MLNTKRSSVTLKPRLKSMNEELVGRAKRGGVHVTKDMRRVKNKQAKELLLALTEKET